MNITEPLHIEYREGVPISVEAAIQLYENSTLAERRPVDRTDIFAGMLKCANLTISAWHGIGKQLVQETPNRLGQSA